MTVEPQQLTDLKVEIQKLSEKLDIALAMFNETDKSVAVLTDRDASRAQSIHAFGRRLGEMETKINKVYIWLALGSGTAAAAGGGLSQLFLGG